MFSLLLLNLIFVTVYVLGHASCDGVYLYFVNFNLVISKP